MNPLHFDMSTLELYAAPLACTPIVIMNELHLRFPASFASRSAEHDVTVWYSVPFLFNQLTDRGGLDRLDLSDLRAVLFGGEPFSPGAVRAFLDALPPVELINVYGPAEVNACTHHHVAPGEDPVIDDDIPIGLPWSGARVTVRGEDGQPVEPGSPGELWVSATTRMRGYHQLDDLTAHRTVACDDGPDWYRTGDVVAETAAGLVYRGRVDHQVKVRGVRLELEAIEAALTDAPGVAHAVAGAVHRGGEATNIAAAIVPEEHVDIDLAAVRAWCVERLVSVAVPTSIEIYEHFPSTPSGKIDRRAVRAEMNPEEILQ